RARTGRPRRAAQGARPPAPGTARHRLDGARPPRLVARHGRAPAAGSGHPAPGRRDRRLQSRREVPIGAACSRGGVCRWSGRRAGLLTVAHLTLGREGDDAGVFARAVWLSTAGRVAFPRLAAHEGGPMSPDELGRGLAWAVRALHRHRAIWRRTGIAAADSRAALIANY